MSVVYIATIVAFSTMGVGYAAWNSDLNLEMTIKTGYIEARIKEIENLYLEDGEWIEFKLSDDHQTLYIEGEVYPSFNRNMPLEILDEGSIPVLLKNMDAITDTDIIELRKDESSNNRSNAYETIAESFQINISPYNDDRVVRRSCLQDEYDISSLEAMINQYNTERNYPFEYQLLLEQSL